MPKALVNARAKARKYLTTAEKQLRLGPHEALQRRRSHARRRVAEKFCNTECTSLCSCGEEVRERLYQVRSSHRLPGGDEQASSLNTCFASAVVCIVRAQQEGTPATSLE